VWFYSGVHLERRYADETDSMVLLNL
jgi:hypothetical protein